MPTQRQLNIIEAAADRWNIAPRILYGLWGAETNFGRNTGPSSAGALGDFQFMPETARGMGVNPHNFRSAAFGAARYLSQYKDRGVRGMLAAYNAGPAGNPNNPETRAYIPRVLELAQGWPGARGGGGGGAAGGGGAGGMGGADLGAPYQRRQFGGGGSGMLGVLSALSQGQGQAQAAPSSGLPLPSFAAGPAMAGQVPQSTSAPVQRPDIGALVAAVAGLEGEGVERAQDGGPMMMQGGQGGQGATGRGRGRVTLAPGADRAGVETSPEVLRFARQISAIAGGRVTIGTGTQHSRLTVNGNVSQHWTGDAGDIPASGRRLIRLGQAALIAAGMPEREARRQRGGLYNVNGRQIIFNTQQGGDHTDHLHIGL